MDRASGGVRAGALGLLLTELGTQEQKSDWGE